MRDFIGIREKIQRQDSYNTAHYYIITRKDSIQMRWPDCKILRTLQLFVSYKHRIRAQPFTGTRGARDPALTIFRPASNDNNIRPECLSCSVSYTHRLLNNNTVYNINNNNNITIISLYSTLTKNIQAIRCIILIFIYQIPI